MKWKPCKMCEGKGYIEISSLDPAEICEECEGFGKVVKQLTIDELRVQFEIGYACSKNRDKDGDHYDLDLNNYWYGYIECAENNNLIKQ